MVLSTGWAYGRAFGHPRLTGADQPWPEHEDLYLLFPEPEEGGPPMWHSQGDLIPAGLLAAMDFFWPGPVVFGVRCPATRRRLKLACPWHPMMRELLARHGLCLWTPVSPAEERRLLERRGNDGESLDGDRALVWPDPEVPIKPTYLDASTVPWRLMESGFVEVDELSTRISEPFLLSQDRAFPSRGLRTFVPQTRTVVLEAELKTELPALVESFRQKVGPDWALRVYLEEALAHTHFPEDRDVRVFGEMTDPERVRRRLEAMLERQRRRSGKRILLIGVAELNVAADSLKADLQKLSDRWLLVPKGGVLETEEFR